MKKKYKNISTNFPIFFKLYKSEISVNVEHRLIDVNKCIPTTKKQKENIVYAYDIGEFGRNYFQTIKRTCRISNCEKIREKPEDMENVLDYIIVEEFKRLNDEIGRYCLYGEKRKSNNIYNVGGILSPLFNAEINNDGKITVKDKEYKIIIYYIAKPALKERLSKNSSDKYMYWTYKFTVSLEKV